MPKKNSHTIEIYTDGACRPNPGQGGWAAIIIAPDQEAQEIKGTVKHTTNNRMELQAALEALKYLREPATIQLYTDSKYLQRGIKEWMPGWQNKDWKTIDNSRVKNQDLWQHLAAQIERHRVQWLWIKGHASNTWNERADLLARSTLPKTIYPLADKQAIHIFTAISFLNKEKLGSWAAMLTYKNHQKLLYGKTGETTGNRMHILAATKGLTAIKKQIPVNLYTFSGYLQEGASKWTKQWAANNWLTREGRAVRHQDLWHKLHKLNNNLQVKYHLASKEEPPCELQAIKILASEIAKTED